MKLIVSYQFLPNRDVNNRLYNKNISPLARIKSMRLSAL
jgi:hypothetical protein